MTAADLLVAVPVAGVAFMLAYEALRLRRRRR
jgi:hypothetical protein